MPFQKIIVKTRKEGKNYLAYFTELKRIIPLNKIGKEIVELFFNKKYSIDKISSAFSKKYGISKNDIKKFILDLRKELDVPHEGGYPIIEGELMNIPLAVELQTNTTCNLRCKHCCQADYKDIMPLKKIRAIFGILNKAMVFEMILVGGEIFLHPDVKKIVDLSCKKYQFSTLIVTNGTLFNKSLINYFSKFKDNLAFLVSLEGMDETNDFIRGKGVFAKVDKNLRILKKAGFHIEISATINNFNINYYQDLIDYCQSLKIPLNFNLFKPFKKKQNFLILPTKKYFDFVNNIFRQRRLKKINIGLTNAAITAEIIGESKRKECKATLSGLTIDVHGRMVPCPFLEEIGLYDWKKLPKFDENFVQTWQNNKYFKKFRKGNLKECQALAYIFKNDTNKKSPYGISAFRKYIKTKI